MPTIFAVHISGLVLTWPWLAAGFIGMAALVGVGLWRIRDDDVPRLAMMTSVFFVASSVHIKFGPASVHLLMNGLVGVILGRRAAIAVSIGTLFHAVLLGHGDLATWGVNTCVMSLPALLARPGFRFLSRQRNRFAVNRIGLTAEFGAGFVVGCGTVLLTVLLNCAALIGGGIDDWRYVAMLSLTAHIPVALIEGISVGAVVNLVMRVKPELFLPPSDDAPFKSEEKSRPAEPPTVPTPR